MGFYDDDNAAAILGGNNDGDMIEIDLTGVSADGTVPEGIYLVECVDVNQRSSKQGNPMYVWDFLIASGPYEGSRIKSYYTVLTPRTAYMVAKVITALGLGEAGKPVKFRANDAKGRTCAAYIFPDEYNGRKNNAIKYVQHISELEPDVAVAIARKTKSSVWDSVSDMVTDEDLPF